MKSSSKLATCAPFFVGQQAMDLKMLEYKGIKLIAPKKPCITLRPTAGQLVAQLAKLKPTKACFSRARLLAEIPVAAKAFRTKSEGPCLIGNQALKRKLKEFRGLSSVAPKVPASIRPSKKADLHSALMKEIVSMPKYNFPKTKLPKELVCAIRPDLHSLLMKQIRLLSKKRALAVPKTHANANLHSALMKEIRCKKPVKKPSLDQAVAIGNKTLQIKLKEFTGLKKIANKEKKQAVQTIKPHPWKAYLQTLNTMGFEDRMYNISLLIKFNGDLTAVVDQLLK